MPRLKLHSLRIAFTVPKHASCHLATRQHCSAERHRAIASGLGSRPPAHRTSTSPMKTITQNLRPGLQTLPHNVTYRATKLASSICFADDGGQDGSQRPFYLFLFCSSFACFFFCFLCLPFSRPGAAEACSCVLDGPGPSSANLSSALDLIISITVSIVASVIVLQADRAV